MPEQKEIYRPKKLSIEEIKSGCIYVYGENSEESQICVMNEEFRQGFDIVKRLKDGNKAITFYGSARLPVDNTYYQKALSISRRLARDLNCMITTGGGPGIMEAGNRGAYEMGKPSLGLTINLDHEQKTNPYVTEEVPFYYFFTRKTLMAYQTEVCIYFPGGFGTLDELFEILTLVQTKKISKVEIILVGVSFWKPLDAFIREKLATENQTISPEDLNLYTITDDEDQIVEIVKNAPMRED
jgi:uncharacterized protein (TIGR00730 family)